MGIYAALGLAQALAFFLMGSMFALFTYFASQRLHRVRSEILSLSEVLKSRQDAIDRVMHAPMSFFETTVLARLLCCNLVLTDG
jgi:hypothetical protein